MLSINTCHTWYDNDPYILADHCQQVFYLKDPKKHSSDWRVVQKVQHHHLFDRAFFETEDFNDDAITDEPMEDEPLQQEISRPWSNLDDRIFIDLRTLA